MHWTGSSATWLTCCWSQWAFFLDLMTLVFLCPESESPWFRSFLRLAARSVTCTVNLLEVSEPSVCDNFCFKILHSLAALARLSKTAIFLSFDCYLPNLSGASVPSFGIALSLLLESDFRSFPPELEYFLLNTPNHKKNTIDDFGTGQVSHDAFLAITNKQPRLSWILLHLFSSCFYRQFCYDLRCILSNRLKYQLKSRILRITAKCIIHLLLKLFWHVCLSVKACFDSICASVFSTYITKVAVFSYRFVKT